MTDLNKQYKIKTGDKSSLDITYVEGAGPSFAIESGVLNKCSLVDRPRSTGDKATNSIKSYAFAVRMYSHNKAKIKKIYVPCTGGAMQVAIYSPEINMGSENSAFRFSSELLIAYCPLYAGRNAGGAGSPFYTASTVQLDKGRWEFYERYNANPSTTLTDAIVSGSFTVVISVNWDRTETIEEVIAELLTYGFADPASLDNLTMQGSNSMNFEMLTYDMANDTNPTSSSNYTLHSNKADRVSTVVNQGNFVKALNFVPYVKVVLETVEE